MELIQLTRALVDISSVTGNEQACAEFLKGHLTRLGFEVELQPVSGGRANVFARRGAPQIVLSTHMDTVPPFMPSREDTEFIYGRGSCDAKGIVAAQTVAAAKLVSDGVGNIGLLFLVGEETLSDGARAANLRPPGSKFIINGEPTENKLALGTKGILRVDIRARGRTAHSAYPHLGESAIEKLLDILADLRRLPLPRDPALGDSTMNIGVISGGSAANVIPGEARADVLFRTVNGAAELQKEVEECLRGRCEFDFVRSTPAMQLGKLDGYESAVVAFTTDLPNLTAWGRPMLVGPGSIEVAHTDHECVRKADLERAVELYCRLVKELNARG
ncbi:MAG: peptidase dimerization protein [Acidobacteria bacterium]|nr:MAG: peptidase dimerization protein [Acidobacteriota bacterium]